MVYDQSAYEVRCEWGAEGVSMLARVSDVVVIVDVLSFSTSVEIAASRGAIVFPFRFKDETAYDFARSVGAEVAGRGHPQGFNLSPASLVDLPPGRRLVLPSPNGSTLSLLAQDRTAAVVAGCLRNARAVAEWAMRRGGGSIAVIPAGERWEDGGGLRPCVEDLLGAGAIIAHLRGKLSPEATLAKAAYENFSGDLLGAIQTCVSGREKIGRGEGGDNFLAARLNASDTVPVRNPEGAFEKAV